MSALKDKVVLITGAAGGIGGCTAETIAGRGAVVVLADLDGEGARTGAERIEASGGRASSIAMDITDVSGVERAVAEVVERYGRIDALVHCAGVDCPRGTPTGIDEAHWRSIIDVNLNGAWWVTQAVLPGMIEQGGGRIVLISSLAARLGGAPMSPAYSAAKAGVIGLTINLATSLEKDGILVNAITPGNTGNTGFPFTEERARAYLSTHPLGFGGPQPTADGVAYLLDSSGDWISGTVLNISGGDHRGI